MCGEILQSCTYPYTPYKKQLKEHVHIVLTPSIKPSIYNPISLWVFFGLIQAL